MSFLNEDKVDNVGNVFMCEVIPLWYFHVLLIRVL